MTQSNRVKDLGTLARAGFARAVTERVLQALDSEALAALLREES